VAATLENEVQEKAVVTLAETAAEILMSVGQDKIVICVEMHHQMTKKAPIGDVVRRQVQGPLPGKNFHRGIMT